MDERTDGISRRQLSILLFVSALSPLIRQTPGMAVQSAGSAIWLSALLALVPLPLAGLLLGRLLRKRVPGATANRPSRNEPKNSSRNTAARTRNRRA